MLIMPSFKKVLPGADCESRFSAHSITNSQNIVFTELQYEQKSTESLISNVWVINFSCLTKANCQTVPCIALEIILARSSFYSLH